MKIIRGISIFAVIIICASLKSAGIENVNYEFRIVVPLADTAIKNLVTSIRKAKGIVISYNSKMVVFRVPRESVDSVTLSVKQAGFLDDEKLVRSDVGEELLRLRAQLRVKEDYIQKLYKLTEESDMDGTLNAEEALEQATSERDQIKSSIKRLERMSRYVDFTVIISGPSKTASDRNKSRWFFINDVGIEHSMGTGK